MSGSVTPSDGTDAFVADTWVIKGELTLQSGVSLEHIVVEDGTLDVTGKPTNTLSTIVFSNARVTGSADLETKELVCLIFLLFCIELLNWMSL